MRKISSKDAEHVTTVSSKTESIIALKRNYKLIAGDIRDYSRLQIFHVYFDTSTYDEVEKDVKVTTEGMLGLVGGTMGLLTGKQTKVVQTLFLFQHLPRFLHSQWS